MNHNLLEVLACPICHGKLFFDKERQCLICKFESLAFPIKDGIPVLLRSEAQQIDLTENRQENGGEA